MLINQGIPGDFRLPYTVWAIAVGTLISRLGTSMVLPYITILLVHHKHVAVYWAGIIMGSLYLAQAFGASKMGNLLMHLSFLMTIKSAIFLYTLLFVMLGLLSQYIMTPILICLSFALCFILLGLCSSVIETISQVFISELTSIKQKYFAFSLRYTFINIGTALGPVVALVLGVLNTNITFFTAAIIIFCYYLLLEFTVNDPIGKPKKRKKIVFADKVRLVAKNKRLHYFIIATILCYIGFSQMDTLFAYVTYHYTNSPHVFVIMYAINGISIVMFQIPLIQVVRKINIHYIIFSGILLLSLGLIGVAIATIHPLTYYASMFIFTIGEIFTLSLVGLYTDKLARPEDRYLYLSISNLVLIGKVIGPLLATTLSHFVGIKTALMAVSGLTFSATFFIGMAKKSHSGKCGLKEQL